MTNLAEAETDDQSSVRIHLPAFGIWFDHFLAYEYHEHFLTPTDAWWFDLDQDELTQQDIQALVPGAKVEFRVDDQLQTSGFIDEIEMHTGPHGTIMHVEGRDWLSPAVDAQIDPQMQFSASQTLDELVTSVLSSFGVSNFAIDNVANRNVITGRIYGTRSSKKGKPLKSVVLHQIKPYPNEGAFAFCSRVCQRFGLWLWPASDGQTVIVGKPDFDQEPRYQFRHTTADPSLNNILDGMVRNSRRDQPTVIIGYGGGGGCEFPKSTLRSAIINPTVTVSTNQLSPILKAYPGLKFVTPPTVLASYFTYGDPNARPLYLYDPESHTQDQLDAFVLREMSLRMRGSLGVTYTIEGHKLNGQAVCVDTIAGVEDDRSNLHMQLWVMSRRFHKAAGSTGTRTTVELIRPGTLQF